MDELKNLAELLKHRNAIDEQIAKNMGRPASTGHMGEFVASKILAIDLAPSASNKGHDGRFLQEPLKGQTVNIKFYAKRENVLDFPQNAESEMDDFPNYYLVLTGPKSSAVSSRETHRPLIIESVFLFEAVNIIQAINVRAIDKRGKVVKLGIATSIPEQFWYEAEIYPEQRNDTLSLRPDQKNLLALFSKAVQAHNP